MEKTLNEKDFFRTSDLSLAGTLQIYGYNIETMDRNNSEKIVFVFRRDDALDELIQAFWSRSLRVCPLTYFESLKATKARIYQ